MPDNSTNNQPPLFELPDDAKNPSILQAAKTVLSLTEFCIEFAQVKRVPRYCPGHRENDAEHSFAVAVLGYEMCRAYFPDYDAGLVGSLGIVHDMIEWKSQDVATFKLSDEAISRKEATEHNDLPYVINRLPPHIGSLVTRYEAQVENEAILIKYIDKLSPPAVDALGSGIQVMAQDYGVHNRSDFEAASSALAKRLRTKLGHPEFQQLHLVRDALSATFAAQYTE